jgi:hypothetical protein
LEPEFLVTLGCSSVPRTETFHAAWNRAFEAVVRGAPAPTVSVRAVFASLT